MFKFWASILKEFRLLIRDRVGISLMFIMPIALVVVITSIQNNTFELLNDKKITLVLCNKDNGKTANEIIESLQKTHMFKIISISNNVKENDINSEMKKVDAMVALIIPENYSTNLNNKIDNSTEKALTEFGLKTDSTINISTIAGDSLEIVFNPVLQESYRYSIRSALQSLLLFTENKLMVRALFYSINGKEIPAEFESEMMQKGLSIKETVSGYDNNNVIPNATQHNIPAWTVFAMFFMVISLGGNIVKEKLSGSFIRLKVLPTSYLASLISKQIIYLLVVLVLVMLIFSIGVWVFPLINLPPLNMPSNIFGVFLVSTICGMTAISYALCIGVFAETQEQSSGFGAVSIVILAAIGGVFVPSFAMPHSFQFIIKCSPFYWSLQSYYALFLESKKINDIIINILPLLSSIVVFQIIAFIGLKRKNLI